MGTKRARVGALTSTEGARGRFKKLSASTKRLKENRSPGTDIS